MDDSDFDSDFDDTNVKNKIINKDENATNGDNVDSNQNSDERIDKENDELIKQVNEFLKEKTLSFNGYRDLNGEEIIDDDDESADKTPDYIKKVF